jgi:hypothetical protein
MKFCVHGSGKSASDGISVPRPTLLSAANLNSFWLACLGGMVFLLFASRSSLAQPAAVTSAATDPGTYSIVEAGPHYRVWQRVSAQTNSQGALAPVTNMAYTEICTGLNHLVAGQYVESSENIAITPSGGAATNGQHQVYFAGNINTLGSIHLVTPDGKNLLSHIMALAYFDSSSGTNVLLAALQDSTGQILPSLNQVLYTNAFTNANADVRYTYTRAGLEQDVILRGQLPAPATWNLNPQTTWLQVWTEFDQSPVPQVTLVTNQDNTWQDHFLNWGVMKMGPGKAFSLGDNTALTPVFKYWQVDQASGRSFLVEEVPLPSIAAQLQTLPAGAGASGGAGAGNSPKPAPGSDQFLLARAFDHPVLLARKRPQKAANPMRLAAKNDVSKGLVMDYVTVSSSGSYTFQNDTVYYVSGPASFTSTVTFEGGTILKFSTNGSISLSSGASLVWLGNIFRPVICTAKDDNSLGGWALPGSTGTPSGYYGAPMLNLYNDSATTLRGLRMSYAGTGVYVQDMALNLYDAQFVNCQVGLEAINGGNALVGNALFSSNSTALNVDTSGSITALNATFNSCDYLAYGTGGSFALTNCIAANVTNPETGTFSSITGNFNGLYSTPTNAMFGTTTTTSASSPFQAVGGGSYYLTTNSAFAGVGTTNIDSTALGELQQRTTYPPLVYSNLTLTGSLNLSPQAQRDTNAALSLGFHYDPLDVAFVGIVTLTNGAVL